MHDKHRQEDYNSPSAYLHVLADALTSFEAIFGPAFAMILNITWTYTAIAIVRSIVITRWAIKLLFDTEKNTFSPKLAIYCLSGYPDKAMK